MIRKDKRGQLPEGGRESVHSDGLRPSEIIDPWQLLSESVGMVRGSLKVSPESWLVAASRQWQSERLCQQTISLRESKDRWCYLKILLPTTNNVVA